MARSYLGSVLDTNIGDTERVDSPLQVELMLRLPEWQTFSQGSLINLDNVDTSLLKVLDLILDGQSNLIACLMPVCKRTNVSNIHDPIKQMKNDLWFYTASFSPLFAERGHTWVGHF